MKRLNKKGFTLVELLAVIVILAIVVGIALTTVLPTLKKSRQNAFELTANTAAEYLEKQYQLSLIGETTITIPMSSTTMEDSDFQKAGLKAGNYREGKWYINDDNRACVILKAATNSNPKNGVAGEYYDVDPDETKSAGCTE